MDTTDNSELSFGDTVSGGDASQAGGTSTQVISRDQPEVDQKRRALVQQYIKDIKDSKAHFENDFKRMRSNMDFAYNGDEKAWVEGNNYTVPIVQRHINVAVGSLYARNPKAEAVVKKRLRYQLWDGTLAHMQESAQNAFNDPNSAKVLEEIMTVRDQERMLKKIGRTLEVLFDHYTGVSAPDFRINMKQNIRRAKVCGVAYVWIDYQRILEKRPELDAQISDIRTKLAAVERMAADIKDKQVGEDSATAEELRLNLADLEKQAEIVVRQGMVFDFPRATEIIIDKKCKVMQGFVGADWIAREFDMTPNEVKETWKIDIGKSFTAYAPGGKAVEGDNTPKSDSNVRVWVIYNKKLRQKCVVADGYPDFIEEPATPPHVTNRFWPAHTLVLHPIEHESKLYPLDDVSLLKHPQQEYNSARENLKQHRRQNKPLYFAAKGTLEQTEKDKLLAPESGSVVELGALAGVDKSIEMVIQRFKPVPIDPALYETRSVMDDVARTVGTQEANLGQTSGVSATESSIQQQSQSSTTSSNIEDLDMFFSDIAQDFGEIALMELPRDEVIRIAGPGAVWPEWSREDIIDELFLTIKAGSSGKPNAAAELAKLERALPLLMQAPNVNSVPILEKYCQLLDLDMEDVISEGAPSITALNAMAAKQIAAPAAVAGSAKAGMNAPQLQGPQGNTNAANPQQNEPGAQPAYPAPQDTTQPLATA